MTNITDLQSKRQIQKDVTSNFISSLSGKMFSFGLGLMLLDETGSAISFGIESIIYPVVSILFFVPIGNAVDKYTHKSLLAISTSARLVALIILAGFIGRFTGNGKLFPVIIFLIINSISVNLNDTAYSSSIHELVNNKNIQKLNSLVQGAIAIASIISPAFGAFIYSVLGFKNLVYIEVLATLASLLILLSMDFYSVKSIEVQDVSLGIKNFKVAISYIESRYLIKYIIILATVINFIFTSLTIGMPYIVKNQVKLGNGVLSIFEMSLAIGMLLGSMLMSFYNSDERFKQKLIISFSSLGIELTILGLIFYLVHQILLLCILVALIIGIIGLSLVVMNITGKVKLQETIPTDLLGRVMSLMTTINASVVPLGTLIYTGLFQIIDSGSTILIVSGIVLFLYTSLVLMKAIRVL